MAIVHASDNGHRPDQDATNNGLGQLPVGPGLTTIVLRTPLGVLIVDPFAPPDPTVDRIVKMLGIEIEVRLGGPTPEDLAAPQLSTGLLILLGAGVFIGYSLWNKKHG